ncbi:(13S,14R)-1,13-dihydroxy-N-methylcanadine 13-O-acetyltransferase AT1 [Linum grandiflorum]
MGSLRVETVSKETIKPASPTPDHLRIHKLTILDQTGPSVYVPFCLFYPSSSTELHQRHSIADSLKVSLSNTLSIYYPLAGRYNKDDSFSIECNDHGVDFVVANVAGGHLLSDALRQPDQDRLLPLLPCRPQGTNVDSNSDLVLLAVQVNFFDCGGIAVGVCIWHGISDACTLASFLRTWSGINSGAGKHTVDKNVVVLDCTSLFPPRYICGQTVAKFKATVTTPDSIIKRFVFEADKIESVRTKISSSNWSHHQRPSRVLAVSALIWAAAINIAATHKRRRHDNINENTHHIAAMTTHLRPRVNPALPETVIGNIVQIPVFAKWELIKTMNNNNNNNHEAEYYKALAEKLRESVSTVMDESVRKVVGSERMVMEVVKQFVEEYGEGNLLAISSWCRFRFYETDFGWGKPVWVGFFTMCYNLSMLIDAPDGRGIEAWVTLSKEDMSLFQKDAAILRYASFP